MRVFAFAFVVLVCGILMACDDSSERSLDSDAAARMLRADAAQDVNDAASGDSSVPSEDAGLEVDAEPVFVDDAGLPIVETCEQICGLYDRCDRLDIWPDRSIDNCLTACNAVSDLDSFSRYQLCLQTTPCDGLQECRLPLRPRASCEQVCEGLGTCGADQRVPTGLPEADDCVSGCDTPSLSADIRECGEDMLASPDTCDELQFATCLLRERSPNCLAICERELQCGRVVDVVDCAIDCINRPEPEDPVARRRNQIAANCAQQDGTCEDYENCQFPIEPPPSDEDVARVCEADQDCAFFGVECPERARSLLSVSGSDTAECLVDDLVNTCDESKLSCLSPRIPQPAACNEYCAVAALCDRLPEGLLELECAAACRAAIEGDQPEQLAPFRRGLSCAGSDTCGDFIACLDGDGGSSEITCAAHCERLGECAEVDQMACQGDCEPRIQTVRHWAERHCTAAADGCDAASKCNAPAPPPCATLCELVGACGGNEALCILQCDDADYADPALFAPRFACLASTQSCEARALCDNGDLSGGFACLNWCRRSLECQGAEGDLIECLETCGQGVPGADGVAFEAAFDCLEEAGVNAECGALDACIQAIAPGQLCETVCAEQQRCGVIADPDACVDACVRDAAEPDGIAELQCLLSSMRRSEGCASIARCVGFEPEPASALCQEVCERRRQCDADLDIFLCERSCTPEPEGLLGLDVCLNRAECDQFGLCRAAATEVPEACLSACDTISECDGLIGEGEGALFADLNACGLDCRARAILGNPGYLDSLAPCLGDAMCISESVSACLDGRPQVDCGSGWDAIVACNNQAILALSGIMDRAAYIMTCEEQFMMNAQLVEEQLACLIDTAAMANGDPLVCFGQIGCVLNGLGP